MNQLTESNYLNSTDNGLMFYNTFIAIPVVECPECQTQLLMLIRKVNLNMRITMDLFKNISPAIYVNGDMPECYNCKASFIVNGRIHFKRIGWLPK